MSLEKIKNTTLWINAFENQEISRLGDEADRLRIELINFREKVSQLVAKIDGILPSLTVHDISHLDALWITAETIAGKNYHLNPLETFIFGGAVLVHDSAMCWEAYEGGQAGVRDTVFWKDCYAFELIRLGTNNEENAATAADFFAMRQLHARRASELLGMSWKIPGSENKIYLIEDTSIRTHLGELIGTIAASHHWDISVVAEKLSVQFNPPDFISNSWTVDPVKIACLLRIADAAHISNARAPDFLLALNNPKGISLNHWKAQNKLSGPQVDLSDPLGSAITYTSTNPYLEKDAGAWWVAYDAILMIDAEIKACNALLESRNLPGSKPFAVRKVSGAGSIEILSKYLRVSGWTPFNAQIHVSNIEELVKNLGGEKLYGETNKIEVVLRELIQNARDAVVARKYMDESHKGKITIKIKGSATGTPLICIVDDGVGMSKSVLTGKFLDFGSSFWGSLSLQSEFPGLRSSKFIPVGQFGIGFYSIFMAASAVEIHTRRWVENRNYSCILSFPSGLSFRPLFKEISTAELETDSSTEVRMTLLPGILDTDCCLPFSCNRSGAMEGRVPLKEFVSSLVVGLDVDVHFEEDESQSQLIHNSATVEKKDANSILKKIGCGSGYPWGAEALEREVAEIAPRMRAIEEDGRLLGYAALANKVDSGIKMLGVRTIGGLVVGNSVRSEDSFVGYIEYTPKTASRDVNIPLASSGKLKEWAEEQLRLLEQSECDDLTRLVVASRATDFGADVLKFARIYVHVHGSAGFLSFQQIAEISKSIPVGFLLSQFSDNHIETHHSINQISGVAHIKPLLNSRWLDIELKDGCPIKVNSIAWYIHNAIISLGLKPKWSISNAIYPCYFGNSKLAIVEGLKRE